MSYYTQNFEANGVIYAASGVADSHNHARSSAFSVDVMAWISKAQGDSFTVQTTGSFQSAASSPKRPGRVYKWNGNENHRRWEYAYSLDHSGRKSVNSVFLEVNKKLKKNGGRTGDNIIK